MFRRWQKRYYIAFALPAIAVGIVVATLFYSLITESFNRELLQQGHTESAAKTQTLHNFIEHASQTLDVLHDHPALRRWLVSDFSASEAAEAETLFKTAIDLAPEFTQLRFIDTEGHERIVFNRATPDSGVIMSHADALEDKSLRYYFRESIKLPKNERWISALDLNIENGVIERPLKPVIRISRPVDIDGVRYGILIINIFTQEMLDQLALSSNYHVYLIDNAGEFLLHKNSAYNWSRYLQSGRKLHSFFPDDADAILANDEYTNNNVHSHLLDFPNGEGLKLLFELKTDIEGNHRYTALTIAFIAGTILIFVLLPFVNIAIIRRSNLINKELDFKLKNELAEHRRKDNLLLQQSKLAIMGEMLSMIAHQWRQPLTSIAAIAARLQLSSQLDTLSKEDLSKGCSDINEISQYLSGTINDFRDFFRPKLSTEATSIPFIIDKALMMIDGLISKHEIALTKKYAQVDEIDTYANELLQVILNLVKNAADALSETSQHHRAITIDVFQEKESLFIKVGDNADGIPEAIAAQIFEPYFTTKEAINGTGLGLYMSKVIVEEHLKGSLSFETSAKGTCFTVRIPKAVQAEK